MLSAEFIYTNSCYNDAVQTDNLALPTGLLARYLALTDRMEIYGANMGLPHTKAFGDGLFELRLKSSEGTARVFYCKLIGKRIFMLHSFVKKSQATPTYDLRNAKSRMKEIKNADTC